MLPSRAVGGRALASLGAIILIVSLLLQWWQIGGGPGELPALSNVGISDPRCFLIFLAAMVCLLVASLPIAARKYVAIDHPATYLAVLAATVLGYGLRFADLVGRRLIPWPPTRGIGFWVAGVGIAVLAAGVFAAFRERRTLSSGEGEPRPALEPASEPAESAELDSPLGEELAAIPGQDGDRGKPLYVPDWAMAAWGWLARPSTRPDRSASLDLEPRGRLDRLDIWVVVALVVVLMSMRVYNLGQPPQMYFDEVYHARSAAEFLQDWRYEIPHDIYEWTHPMLAKYAIAGGIGLFSDDKVTAESDLGAPVVKDAIVQVRTAVSPRADTAAQANPDTNYDTDYGDRVLVATGADVRAYDLLTRTMGHVYAIPGAQALSAASSDGMVYVGTSGGLIYRIDTNSLDDLRAGRTTGVAPPSQLVVRTGLEIFHVSVDALPYLLVSDEAGNVVSVDLGVEGGRIVGRGMVPGAAAYAPLFQAQAAGGVVGAEPEVVVACAAGVVVLDARTVAVESTVKTEQAATSIALNPEELQDPSGTEYYRFYVAAGNSVMLLDQRAVAGPADVWLEGDQPLRRMPGAVTSVVFDEATRIAHAVGRTGDGSGWTVYAIESNGNAVFSDARLPFKPVAVGLDNATQVQGFSQVRQMPDADRGILLAFGPSGGLASVDVGQFAFSWRVASVLFGALTAVCLYLLARVLFRRRSVGLIAACLTLIDGMLFAQSRIAMNDAFVGGFLLLAYLIFAVIWLRVWENRLVFWLGMPLLGLLLGLALASKWVALYAIASICLLILIRSALGRLLTIVGLSCGTGVLGWMALAEMRYQPGTGTPLSAVLVCAAVAIVGAGVIWSARTHLLPDKVAVGIASAVLAAGCLAGALILSPGPIDNGAPNYTFFTIMLAVTALAAAANAYRPVAWTAEEFRFAIAAPPVLGLVVPLAGVMLLLPIGFSPSLPVVAALAAGGFGAGLAVGALVAVGFWAAGRVGLGPLARPPKPGSLADLAGPPSPAPDGWLRLGSGFGLPAAWMLVCVAVLPFVVYVLMYVPWSMPWQQQTNETGPLPAIACWHLDEVTRLCDGAWPAGHTGQNLWNLTNVMYTYHDGLRSSHPASSPWWAWPLDLKPVWFDSGGHVPSMFSWIHDAGNPVLWWMAIFGVAFVSWQAMQRRNLGLGLIAVAFFWQWLSWARIDRATFQYHFYTVLPFFLMGLAYLLAELWHGPSRRTWLLARLAGAAALLMPGLLWLLKPELCGLARVNPGEYWEGTVCGAGTGDVIVTTRVLMIFVVLLASLVWLAAVLRRLDHRRARGRGERTWILQILMPVVASLAATSWIVASGPAGVAFHAAMPADSLTLFPVIGGVLAAYFAVTARNPRRFVIGVGVVAILVFAVMYPDLSALWMPNTIQGIYSVLSPTWMYGFWFATNLQASSPVRTISLESGAAILGTLGVAGVAAWAAWERRVALGWRRAGLAATADGAPSEPVPPKSTD